MLSRLSGYLDVLVCLAAVATVLIFVSRGAVPTSPYRFARGPPPDRPTLRRTRTPHAAAGRDG